MIDFPATLRGAGWWNPEGRHFNFLLLQDHGVGLPQDKTSRRSIKMNSVEYETTVHVICSQVSSQQDKHHWAIYQSNLYYTFSRDKGVGRQEKEVTPGLWETFWGDDIVLQHILWWNYMNSHFRKHVNCCHVSNMYLQ